MKAPAPSGNGAKGFARWPVCRTADGLPKLHRAQTLRAVVKKASDFKDGRGARAAPA